MDDLVQWLGEQLNEDERIARDASGSTVIGEPGNWSPSPSGDEWEALEGDVEEELLVALRPGLSRPPDVMSGKWGAWVSTDTDPADDGAGSAMAVLVHAARHDPARVLREIDAKRRLLDDYTVTARIRDEAASRIKDAGDHPDPKDLETWDRAQREAEILEGPVKLAASPFEDRPGFRETWRP